MDGIARIVVIVLIVLLIIALLPAWPYSSGWGLGWYPSGGLGLLLIIIIIIAVLGDKRRP
jgi:hypothetical protein